MKYSCIADDVTLGKDVKLSNFINLYGCTIGDGTKIGPFVRSRKTRGSEKTAKFKAIPLSAKE